MSPISATNTAANTGPTPRDRLDRLIAGMTLQSLMDTYIERHDLAAVASIRSRNESILPAYSSPKSQLVEPALPAGLPDPLQLGDRPLLAQGLMHLALNLDPPIEPLRWCCPVVVGGSWSSPRWWPLSWRC